MLDKKTGKLLGEEASACSRRIFHSNWSSPAYLKTDKVELGIFGGPDGVASTRSSPSRRKDEDGYADAARGLALRLQSADYRVKDGKPIKYATRKGPSECSSTPVVYDGKIVYAVIGQDPEHGEGIGNLVCIDAQGKEVWSYDKIKRSMSTLSISNGLLYVADYSGFVYCLDANTGKEHWVHDTNSHIWGSTLVADGRVFIGTRTASSPSSRRRRSTRRRQWSRST